MSTVERDCDEFRHVTLVREHALKLGSSQERTTDGRRLEGQGKTTEWAVGGCSTCGKGFVCSVSAAGSLVVILS